MYNLGLFLLMLFSYFVVGGAGGMHTAVATERGVVGTHCG